MSNIVSDLALGEGGEVGGEHRRFKDVLSMIIIYQKSMTSDYLNKSRINENITKKFSYKYLRRKKGKESLRPKTPLNLALDDRPFLGYIGRKWEEEGEEGSELKL